jgi:hypothetical protein
MDSYILINDKRIRIDKGVKIPINFRASYGDSIGEILLSYTNTFLIPDNDYNADILENSAAIESNSDMPYKELNAFLYLNGRDLFGSSRLILLDYIEGTGWNCSFIAGLFSKSLKGSIKELDLSAQNFVYDITGFASKLSATSNFTTAISRWTKRFYSNDSYKDIDIMLHYGSYYMYDLIRATFSELGLKAEIVDSDDDFLKRITIPIESPKKIASEYQGWSFEARRSTDVVLSSAVSTIVFNEVVAGNEAVKYNTSTGEMTLNKGSYVKVEAEILFDDASTPGVRSLILQCTNGGSPFPTSSCKVVGVNVTAPQSLNLSIEFQVKQVADARLYLTIEDTFVSGTIKAGSKIRVTVSDRLCYGNTLDIANSMPTISKADLIKQFCIKGNLITWLGTGGMIYFKQFDALSESVARDWSLKKIDKPYSLKVLPDSFGSETLFKYSNDDKVSATLGGASVTLDNSLLKDVVTKYESMFSASDDPAAFVAGLSAMYIPLFDESETPGAGFASKGANPDRITFSVDPQLVYGDYIFIPDINRYCQVRAFSSATIIDFRLFSDDNLPSFTSLTWVKINMSLRVPKQRIGVVNTIQSTIVTAMYADNFGGSTTVTRSLRFDGIEHSLKWSVLLKKYFRLWLGSIERYKQVGFVMKLDLDDVTNLDTMAPVYINGTRFYLEEIAKFVEGDEVNAVLMRLGEAIDSSKIKDM